MDWIEKLKQAKENTPAPLDLMEDEYGDLLARLWSLDDDPSATMDEARRLVARLDELYRILHQAGRRVPVRLPVERSQEKPKTPRNSLAR